VARTPGVVMDEVMKGEQVAGILEALTPDVEA
jgi:hypothetical protein